MAGHARFLEPVHFALHGGRFTVVPEPLEGAHAVHNFARFGRLSGDLPDERNLSLRLDARLGHPVMTLRVFLQGSRLLQNPAGRDSLEIRVLKIEQGLLGDIRLMH